MKVRIVQSESELHSLSSDWDRLAGDNTFCRFNWLANWWRYYGRGNQLLVLVAQDDDANVIGIAPLCRSYRGSTGKCIRFLGSNEVCSDYLRLLVNEEHTQQVVTAFADELLKLNDAKDFRWDTVELTGVKAGEPTTALLVEKLAESGCPVHETQIESCWRLELPNSWEEYSRQHGSSFRRTLKKLDKQFLQTGRAIMHEATCPDSFDRGWEILVELHQKRRKSLGQPGCFSDPRFSKLLETSSRTWLNNGELLLQWIELDSQPMAASICIQHAGCVNMYQSGIDPEMMQHRPGHLQNMLTIRHAIESGVEEYDFLRGDEPYKKLWRAEPVTLTSTRVVAKRMLPMLRHQTWIARRAVGSWIKASRD